MTILVCPGRHLEMVAHYEQLRADVLAQPIRRSTMFGLALFVREGMAGWMRAWADCIKQKNGKLDPPFSTNSPPVSLTAQTEITMILAGMILGRQEELT